MAASPDSLSAQPDSVAVADSTKIGFLQGIGNVKVFRKDMQVACDSLAYNDLDSLIRLYRNPVVWNETRRQYSADSIAVVVKDKAIEKASGSVKEPIKRRNLSPRYLLSILQDGKRQQPAQEQPQAPPKLGLVWAEPFIE